MSTGLTLLSCNRNGPIVALAGSWPAEVGNDNESLANSASVVAGAIWAAAAFVFGVGDSEPGYITLSGTIKATPPSR
jgi:hypothetical protein